MTTAHDAHLMHGYVDVSDAPELSSDEVTEANDQAARELFADDGKELAFETLREGAYVMAILMQSGWRGFEDDHKNRSDWPQLAKQARELLRLCASAQQRFQDACAAKQAELADDARLAAEDARYAA